MCLQQADLVIQFCKLSGKQQVQQDNFVNLEKNTHTHTHHTHRDTQGRTRRYIHADRQTDRYTDKETQTQTHIRTYVQKSASHNEKHITATVHLRKEGREREKKKNTRARNEKHTQKHITKVVSLRKWNDPIREDRPATFCKWLTNPPSKRLEMSLTHFVASVHRT